MSPFCYRASILYSIVASTDFSPSQIEWIHESHQWLFHKQKSNDLLCKILEYDESTTKFFYSLPRADRGLL